MEIYIGINEETNKLYLPDNIIGYDGNVIEFIWKLTYDEKGVLTTKENRKLYIFIFLLYSMTSEKFIINNENLLYFDNLIDSMPK